MKRSIGLASGPSGNAGRATGCKDHQRFPLVWLVEEPLFAAAIERQRPAIPTPTRARARRWRIMALFWRCVSLRTMTIPALLSFGACNDLKQDHRAAAAPGIAAPGRRRFRPAAPGEIVRHP